MNIAIDISPLKTGHFLQHRVRGTGFYLKNLNSSLQKYFPENSYSNFTRGEKIPKNSDLIHYPYFEPFFLTLPFFVNKKFIVTVHDLTPLVFSANFPSGVKGKIKWFLQRIRLKKASHIITDSQSSKKDIMRFVGIKESKISVVYLASSENFGIVRKAEVDRVKKKYNLPDKFVLYVGDVTWNKNLPALLQAVRIANLPLVMVGSALEQENFDKANPWNQDLVKVQEFIKSHKSSALSPIFSLGFVSDEDLVALYNGATVFAMPSLYEGFGLPILEAMSCGCPVVTSREGSLPEIAGQAVLYVDAYDVDSISKGINSVFTDESIAKKLSEKGTIQAKKFSWEKTAAGTVQVYEKVAGEK